MSSSIQSDLKAEKRKKKREREIATDWNHNQISRID